MAQRDLLDVSIWNLVFPFIWKLFSFRFRFVKLTEKCSFGFVPFYVILFQFFFVCTKREKKEKIIMKYNKKNHRHGQKGKRRRIVLIKNTKIVFNIIKSFVRSRMQTCFRYFFFR